MARRVYFEFEDDAVAEKFADDVMGWLCEDIAIPDGESAVGSPLYRAVPRHWLYEDASACSERIPDDGPERDIAGAVQLLADMLALEGIKDGGSIALRYLHEIGYSSCDGAPS